MFKDLFNRLFKRARDVAPVTLVLRRETNGHIAVTPIGPCTPQDALQVLERVHGELVRQMQQGGGA